ncbi:MAG: KpsF/GutQ family sugar-phosphate isomerase [Candidatus Omnitrophica bacterium]|nr:KpsF/GutQ family sugar-phosphate isomerase [Candidatus Omnitrophota bacterium]
MVCELAKEVLTIEADAIRRLIDVIDENFENAVNLMFQCSGRVIVTGMGKPGLIGRKIAATLASTGTPSLFLHPAEAIHGDLGMVTKDDVVLAISHSGETEEIVKLLNTIKKIGAKLISLTGNKKSTLAKNSNIVLHICIDKEACPLGLAPTASTTAQLAMGDALAVTLLDKRGFKAEDFAFYHPGGNLGRQLLTVADIMRKGDANPIVKEKVTVKEALLAITGARAGSCSVVNTKGVLTGIFTDGDLRRHFEKEDAQDLSREKISLVMTVNPRSIHQDKLAAEALNILKENKIDELPVVDDEDKPVGLLDVQDLLRAGFL